MKTVFEPIEELRILECSKIFAGVDGRSDRIL